MRVVDALVERCGFLDRAAYYEAAQPPGDVLRRYHEVAGRAAGKLVRLRQARELLDSLEVVPPREAEGSGAA